MNSAGYEARVPELCHLATRFGVQEEYVKDETKNLKRELLRAQEEVKRIQSVPLVIGQFLEMIDANHGVVSSTAGSHYYVRVCAPARILPRWGRAMRAPSFGALLNACSDCGGIRC